MRFPFFVHEQDLDLARAAVPAEFLLTATATATAPNVP